MLSVNSQSAYNIQEIDANQLSAISGGAYFWDDLQATTTSTTDVPVNNLIPLPR